MNTYCIFFDIDGTILDIETNTVPQSTIEALRLAKERGHYLFINTGRCKDFWPEKILALGFDGVVGGCGTHLYLGDEEVLHHTIEPSVCTEIVEDLLHLNIDGVLEGANKTYFRPTLLLPEVKEVFEEIQAYGKDVGRWTDANLEFDKFVLWYEDTKDMEKFREKYSDRFDFICRSANFYEVVPKGFSKGTGMDVMMERLGIKQEYSIAMGDSTNDLPMFEHAGISVGIRTENQVVMDAVDYITDPVIENGVYSALIHFNIIEPNGKIG